MAPASAVSETATTGAVSYNSMYSITNPSVSLFNLSLVLSSLESLHTLFFCGFDPQFVWAWRTHSYDQWHSGIFIVHDMLTYLFDTVWSSGFRCRHCQPRSSTGQPLVDSWSCHSRWTCSRHYSNWLSKWSCFSPSRIQSWQGYQSEGHQQNPTQIGD